jgi:hypothetical protein
VNIVVGSAFRNFAGRVRGYFNQVVDALQSTWAKRIRAHHRRRGRLERQHARVLTMLSDYMGMTSSSSRAITGSGSSPRPRMPIVSSRCRKSATRSSAAVRETDDVLLYVECDLLWDAATWAH